MAKNKGSKRGQKRGGGGGGSGGGKGRSSKPKPAPRVFAKGPLQGPSDPENPFELRINKRKHDNLGKRARNERGVPGISRSRAVEKRKVTLLQEYKVRNKTSLLLDNRIGEKRKGMPEEEKIIRRSVAEKARQFKQKSIFNLQDTDDLLTHRGKPLLEVDRYEDPRDESDSDEERLNAEFVSDANFGGFMKLKKKEEVDETELDDEGHPKSHKQIIQELIMESKKKKYEKAKEADENYEIVCKLDDDFKNPEMRDILFGVKKVQTPTSTTETSEKDDYDKLVRELQFEAKTGNATQRLKSEEELAQEEVVKAEETENERKERMKASLKSKLLEKLSRTKTTEIKAVIYLFDIIDKVYELSMESKKYAPEVVNALSSFLNCYTGDEKRPTGFIIPTIRPAKTFLYISEEECTESTDITDPDEMVKFRIDDDSKSAAPDVSDKLRILCNCLDMTEQFITLYKYLPASVEIFNPIKKALTDLQQKLYPVPVSEKLKAILEEISSLKKKKEVLVHAAERPKPLKLYEPLIEEDFDGIRRKKVPKGKQEAARLQHKIKQETKSAVREIKKDTSFLAKQQLREQLEKDAERKRKVKEIMGSLANQEGDYNKSKRVKK